MAETSPLKPGGQKGESGQDGEPEWRIILTGKSGGGKSATGNTLLGQEKFLSMLGAKTTTQECKKEKGQWNGQEFSLIDTPAIFDSKTPRKKYLRKKCIKHSQPGPHALVFVTQVGRFTKEDEAAAKKVRKVFGAEAVKHIIVLFTRKEDLGGGSVRDYVEQSDNEALRKLVQKCGNRVCAFNNRAGGAEREQQVSELMGMVQGMVQEKKEQGRRTYCRKKRVWLLLQTLRGRGGSREGSTELCTVQVSKRDSLGRA